MFVIHIHDYTPNELATRVAKALINSIYNTLVFDIYGNMDYVYTPDNPSHYPMILRRTGDVIRTYADINDDIEVVDKLYTKHVAIRYTGNKPQITYAEIEAAILVLWAEYPALRALVAHSTNIDMTSQPTNIAKALASLVDPDMNLIMTQIRRGPTLGVFIVLDDLHVLMPGLRHEFTQDSIRPAVRRLLCGSFRYAGDHFHPLLFALSDFWSKKSNLLNMPKRPIEGLPLMNAETLTLMGIDIKQHCERCGSRLWGRYNICTAPTNDLLSLCQICTYDNTFINNVTPLFAAEHPTRDVDIIMMSNTQPEINYKDIYPAVHWPKLGAEHIKELLSSKGIEYIENVPDTFGICTTTAADLYLVTTVPVTQKIYLACRDTEMMVTDI